MQTTYLGPNCSRDELHYTNDSGAESVRRPLVWPRNGVTERKAKELKVLQGDEQDFRVKHKPEDWDDLIVTVFPGPRRAEEVVS